MPTDPGAQALVRALELIGEPVLLAASEGEPRAAPRIVYVNAALARLVGRTSGELRGQTLHVLAGADTDPLEFARLIHAVDRGEPAELTLRLAGTAGRPVWVEARGRPLGDKLPFYLLQLHDVTRRRRLLANSQRLEQRFAALSRLTSDCVYYLRVEPDCRLVLEWAAGAFSRLTGYSPADLKALGGWTALVDPLDLRAVQRRAQRLLAGDEASVEYRIRTRSGERLWLRDVGLPQWDEAHELVIGVLCAARDITEQRRQEEREMTGQVARKALGALLDGLLCEFDQQGCLRAVSGRLPGTLGERLRGAIGQSLSDLFGASGAEVWRRELERLAPGWAPVEFTFTYPDEGCDEHYRVRLSATTGGSALALIRAASAMTAPARSAPLDRALLDLQPHAAVLLAPDLTVVELNKAAESLTGWRREDVVERPFVELTGLASAQPGLLQDLERARSGIRVTGSEAWLRLPGGQEGRIVWNFMPLRSSEGTPLGILAEGTTVAQIDQSAANGDERRLKAILDSVADGVVALDRQGDIVAFSRSAETIFGADRTEVIGQSVAGLILPAPDNDGDVLQAILDVIQTAGESREFAARRRSGEVIPIELAASAVSFNGDTLYILTIRDITLRKQTEETIRNLAYHDPLTGLPNRLLFHDRLTQAIERARRHRQQLAVMILDLDRFKLINDSLGLASGDQVLRLVAERLLTTLRKSDTVARLSGDDFLLLLPGVAGADSAAKVARKLLEAFADPIRIDQQELHIGASLGITLYPHDGDDAETLIRNADTALYRAKEHARGSYQFYTTDMNATAFERLVLETQLRKAVEQGELVLYYQPQVRIDTGAIVGVEALVRWFHRDLGLIPPSEFIPLAEETGLIVELGQWVLRTACTEMRRWHERGFPRLRLAVNLSGRQFQHEGLVRSIERLIGEVGFDANDLELELTESSIMRDPDRAVAKLEALDRLGIRLWHRLLFPRTPQTLSHPHAEDRPVLHSGHHHRSQRRGHHPGDHRAGRAPGSQCHRRRC